jgi:hypothetical protein
MLPWVIVIASGVIALHIPIAIIERNSLQNRTFFMKEFARGMPRWVVPCVVSCGLFAVAHFVWFVIESRGASPTVENGQYLLNSHGRIIGILTQTQFKMLKSLELRGFAALMISCYLFAASYWWFPRLTRVNTSSSAHEGSATVLASRR